MTLSFQVTFARRGAVGKFIGTLEQKRRYKNSGSMVIAARKLKKKERIEESNITTVNNLSPALFACEKKTI